MSETYDYTMFVELEHIRGFTCGQSPEELKRICGEKPQEYFRIVGEVIQHMLEDGEIGITNAIIVAGDVASEDDGEEVFAKNNMLFDQDHVLSTGDWGDVRLVKLMPEEVDAYHDRIEEINDANLSEETE